MCIIYGFVSGIDNIVELLVLNIPFKCEGPLQQGLQRRRNCKIINWTGHNDDIRITHLAENPVHIIMNHANTAALAGAAIPAESDVFLSDSLTFPRSFLRPQRLLRNSSHKISEFPFFLGLPDRIKTLLSIYNHLVPRNSYQIYTITGYL